ncbi:MAG: NnrS family protein [Archangiaceae bacterium]|nr:NnrS family protein [Archangiaceae bacterium]
MTTSTAPQLSRTWQGHPLWLVGFRPFFPLACLLAVVTPLLWVLMLAGILAPPTWLTPMQWHAHEMFHGFGFTVLGGFLLTATKNWTQVRGHHGRTLQLLVATWLVERVAIWFGGAWPAWLRWAAVSLYTACLVGLVLETLVRGRRADTLPDNWLFVVALPVLLVARTLVLLPEHFAAGVTLTLALFRLAFIVMLERTLPPFMKAAFQVTLPRVGWLDTAIKGLALVLVASASLPSARLVLQPALAFLVAARFMRWSPHLAFRRIELAVMYLGGLALAAQLVLEVLPVRWVGTLPVHVFTFGTMGLIIPAMFFRIAAGHTGRPVQFGSIERAVLWVMLVAFGARVIAPQLAPTLYRELLWVAAACWMVGFTVVGLRITPMLLAERIDGKEH